MTTSKSTCLSLTTRVACVDPTGKVSVEGLGAARVATRVTVVTLDSARSCGGGGCRDERNNNPLRDIFRAASRPFPGFLNSG